MRNGNAKVYALTENDTTACAPALPACAGWGSDMGGVNTGGIVAASYTGTVYFALLRMDTSGNASSIPLGNWNVAGNCGLQSGATVATPINVTVITNADQGTVLTWQVMSSFNNNGAQGPTTTTNYIASTSGTSVVSQGTTPTLLTPVVQAQDGTFYGTDSNGNMDNFDQSGNIKWGVPGDFPQIATADGGVIGASGTTYDSSGNATGQLTNMAIQSWPGYAYTDGPVDQINSPIITEANVFSPFTNFWPVANANDSGSKTAKKLPAPDANHNHALTVRDVKGQRVNYFNHITVQVDNNQEVGFGPVDNLTALQKVDMVKNNTPVPGNIEPQISN